MAQRIHSTYLDATEEEIVTAIAHANGLSANAVIRNCVRQRFELPAPPLHVPDEVADKITALRERRAR